MTRSIEAHGTWRSSIAGLTSLYQLLEIRAQEQGDQIYLHCEDAAVSYTALWEQASRMARLFRRLGVQVGDRVVAMLGNTLEFPVALFAAARSGAILVPLNWQHRGEVLRYMVRHAEPRLLIVDGALVDREQLDDVIQAAPGVPLLDIAEGGFLERLADMPASEEEPVAGGPISIMYTSGTTGRSKGALLDQLFYLREGDAYVKVVEPRPDDVFFTTLPLFHTNAQCLTLVGSLIAGVPCVILRRFSASQFWDQARKYGATVVNLLGAMVPILLKVHPEAVRDHRVRLAVGGGVPVASVREFTSRFGTEFREIYGLTETGLNAGHVAGATKPGTVGRPLPDWDIRVVPLKPGSPEGEIQIRARSESAIFREYWRDPDRTREAFTEDGWFKTGDLGAFDEEGYLCFRGRLKDSIRRRGENISAAEVEMIINAHPAVLESAAVAVPSELAEDEVKVVYVLRPGATISVEELYAYCRQNMAPFMVPRYFEERDELPKTLTEKVEKYRLVGTEGPRVVDVQNFAR